MNATYNSIKMIKKVPIMFAKLRKKVLCRWLGDGTGVVDWCTYYDEVTAFDVD